MKSHILQTATGLTRSALRLAAQPLLLRRRERVDAIVRQYREHDDYVPDVVRFPAQTVHIESALPSEPPQGVTYRFCATGYFNRGRDREYCAIHSPWRNVSNFCHWMFSELPLIHLAMESGAVVALPRALLEPKLPFQAFSWQILRDRFPAVRTIRLSELPRRCHPVEPVNHDTSSSTRPIGRCEYRHYHHSRATPYALEVFDRLTPAFRREGPRARSIYIHRATRRLRNEREVQSLLSRHGVEIVRLEESSLGQQATLFADADMVIGFHGAGLANLVFARPGTRVVEIVDRDCVYPCYRDGVVVPGKKATRTYFHMVASMRSLRYACAESDDYQLSLERLEAAMEATARPSPSPGTALANTR